MFESEISKCQLCGRRMRDVKSLPGSGNSHALIMFVGMNPSHRRFSETDAAFKGGYGDDFRKILQEAGIPEAECYITNLAKCSFADNTITDKEGAECFSQFLFREIKAIKPLVVVCMGTQVDKIVSESLHGVSIAKIWHPNYVINYKPELRGKYVDELRQIYKSFVIKSGITSVDIKNVFFEGPDKCGKTTLRKKFASEFSQSFYTADRSIVSNMVYDELYSRNSRFKKSDLDSLKQNSIFIYCRMSDSGKHAVMLEGEKTKVLNADVQYGAFDSYFAYLEYQGFLVMRLDTSKSLDESFDELCNFVKERMRGEQL